VLTEQLIPHANLVLGGAEGRSRETYELEKSHDDRTRRLRAGGSVAGASTVAAFLVWTDLQFAGKLGPRTQF